MVTQEDNGSSIHNRISNILVRDRSGQREFGVAWIEEEDAEELEYMLARAEADLREAQARVDEIKRKLAR